MRASIDNWHGVHCHEEFFDIRSTSELLDGLNRLDGNKHTLLNLIASEHGYLMIGGGNGQYVLSGEEDGMIFNLLNQDCHTDEKIELNAGGQIGLFERKYIVSKEQAINCALAFFTKKAIPKETQYNWEVY